MKWMTRLGKLGTFLGVMMGVAGASTAVTGFANNIARPALQKQIANKALTKTAYYTPIKQILKRGSWEFSVGERRAGVTGSG